MYRKIALIFFGLAFIVLSIGFYFFLHSKHSQNNKQAIVPAKTPTEIIEVAKKQEAKKQQEIEQENQEIQAVNKLKQLIKQKIKEKDALIRSTGSGRPYTKDEVDFVLNPRENIIKEMKAKGEITEEQIKLLNSTN